MLLAHASNGNLYLLVERVSLHRKNWQGDATYVQALIILTPAWPFGRPMVKSIVHLAI